MAIVSIEAMKDGIVVYKVDKVYSGTSGVVDTTLVHVPRTPKRPVVTSVSFDRDTIKVFAEGAPEELRVTILPSGADDRLSYFMADTNLASIKDGYVLGPEAGQTWLTATSVDNAGKSDTLQLVILPKPPIPVDSVSVFEDSLELFTGGISGRLTAAIHPGTHSPRFVWRSSTLSVATVDSLGNVDPIGPGRAYVRVQSAADTSKNDSCLIIVRRDVPRLDPGADTTISTGATVVFRLRVIQYYGGIRKVRWDLDGDGDWDDSGTVFRDTSRIFTSAGTFTARFYALDDEGNDTLAMRMIKVVDGPAIHFQDPADSTFTNKNPISVTWIVDGTRMTSLDSLKSGPNILTRTARNSAGDSESVSIIVFYDTIPPGKPAIKGPPASVIRRPTWAWETSGGGDGSFRYRLDNGNMAVGTTVVRDSIFTPDSDLADGPHTLYVQERDAAGNWSTAGSFTIHVDATPPNAPVIDSNPLSPVAGLRPVLKWASGGNGGSGQFRFKLDNEAFSEYTPATTYQPTLQKEGPYTFHVQERDSLGNESAVSSRRINVVEKGFMGARGAINASGAHASNCNTKGVLHIATQESGYGYIWSYMNGWRTLGNAFAGEVSDIHSLVFNRDTAFVCYSETGGYRGIAVRKYLNGVWVPVGQNPIDSLGTTNDASLAISPEGIPYICWITATETNIHVARLNPSTNRWESVGSGPVSLKADYWNRVSIAFDAHGVVHIAYNESAAGFSPTVKKLVGGSWVQVFQYPSANGHNIKLAFHGNSAYLASEQQSGPINMTHILGFGPAGETTFENSVAGINPDLAISSDGTPFVTVNSGDESENLRIYSISAGALRTAVLPAPSNRPSSISVGPLGIPFFSFSDLEAGGQISAYKFGFDPQ